eukprot:423890-Amorphochlora_amoeboformis.AAC.1
MLAPDFQIDDTGLTQGEYAFNHFLRWGRNAKTDPTPTCEKCSLACNEERGRETRERGDLGDSSSIPIANYNLDNAAQQTAT